MPFRSAVVDRVHIVRWKEPTIADIAPVVAELRNARERLGPPVFGIAVVPLDCVPASDDVRARMASHVDVLLESAESLHFVIEGTGFRQSIIRSTITTILFLSKNRGRVFVHQRLDGALAQIRQQLTWPVADILERAERLQLLTPDATRFQSNRV